MTNGAQPTSAAARRVSCTRHTPHKAHRPLAHATIAAPHSPSPASLVCVCRSSRLLVGACCASCSAAGVSKAPSPTLESANLDAAIAAKSQSKQAKSSEPIKNANLLQLKKLLLTNLNWRNEKKQHQSILVQRTGCWCLWTKPKNPTPF